MNLKKYEEFLSELNTKITSWNFSLEENKEKLETIVEVYKALREKDYKKVKTLISNIWFDEEVSKKESVCRDWNIETQIDEENIEAFNSIEMMSAIFLQNIKDQLWTQI